MKIKEAVTKRVSDLCKKQGIALNELAVRSGVTPSTVYSMMDDSRHDISILTIKKLCDGFDITISEFFESNIFANLEQEID